MSWKRFRKDNDVIILDLAALISLRAVNISDADGPDGVVVDGVVVDGVVVDGVVVDGVVVDGVVVDGDPAFVAEEDGAEAVGPIELDVEAIRDDPEVRLILNIFASSAVVVRSSNSKLSPCGLMSQFPILRVLNERLFGSTFAAGPVAPGAPASPLGPAAPVGPRSPRSP